MKIFAILFFLISLNAFGATCTTTTRTNYSSGQTLTSSALNADFNQLVTKANAFDGGCVTDGSLEASALNSTDFATVTNGLHQGCALVFVDVNTIGIGKCILSVNGTFVKTVAQNNVTWACSGCSAEANSTQYYVYAKTGSTGTTLNLLISTTAPGVDGYDVSGSKVLGRFYNNLSGEIESREILTWANNFYAPSDRIVTVPTAVVGVDYFAFFMAKAGALCNSNPCTIAERFTNGLVTAVNRTGTGVYDVTLSIPYDTVHCISSASSGSTRLPAQNATNTSTTNIQLTAFDTSGSAIDAAMNVYCWGRRKL